MLVTFLRIIRKITSLAQRYSFKCRLFYYVQLSKGRYSIHSSLQAGKEFSIKSDLSENVVKLARAVIFRDYSHIVIGHAGKLVIENNCFFNNGCSINCFGSIQIGQNNQFGENVLFYDHNHVYADNNKLISDQGYSIGQITIGDNCWVGSNVVILKDVVIGDGCIIGAGCVIYKSVPAYSIVVNQQDLNIKPRL